MGDAVLLHRLGHRQLVVAAELHLPVDDVEDRVRAPARLVGVTATRLGAAAPLIGEHDLGAVVVERGRVPVGEVRVRDLVDPDGVRRVADVDQDAVALAGARGQADLRIGGDVVTGVRDRGRPPGRARGVQRRWRLVLQTVDRTRFGVGEEPGLVHDRRLLGRVQRDFDHLDPPPSRVRPGRRVVHAARPLSTPVARRRCRRRRRRSCRGRLDRSPACGCGSRGRPGRRPPARGC